MIIFGTFHGCKVNPTEKIVGELRKSIGEGARAEISTVALAGAFVLHVKGALLAMRAGARDAA